MGKVAAEIQSRLMAALAPTTLEVIDDSHQGSLRMLDFAPRFQRFGRMFRPPMLVRRIEPIAGRPRITLRLRPNFDYGARPPQITSGSNHVR